MKFRFSIVGIPHYIKEQELEKFYNDIIGKEVSLFFDKENLYDSNAIKVLDASGYKIGYVNAKEVREKIYSLVHQNHKVQYAKVICRSPEYSSSLIAEMESSFVPNSLEDMEREQLAWTYSHLVLPTPEKWTSLIDVMTLLLDKLDNEAVTTEEVQGLLERYQALAHYGFSKEFYESRTALAKKLKAHPNPEVAQLERVMVEMSPKIHNPALHNAALNEIHKSLKSQITNTYREEIATYKLKDVVGELETFPHDLYKYRGKADVFATRVFYERMPSEVLLKFLSGVALAGVLGKGGNPSKSKKKSAKSLSKKVGKRGRPLKGDMGDFPIYNFIIGDKRERDFWKTILIDMMAGKKSKYAAEVMYAAHEAGVLDDYPYAEVDASFGIGSRNGYQSEIRRLKAGGSSTAVNAYIEFLEQRKKDIRSQ